MSFKALEEEQIAHFYASGIAQKVEQDLQGKIRFYQFFGSVMELYVSTLADTMLKMSGIAEDEKKDV